MVVAKPVEIEPVIPPAVYEQMAEVRPPDMQVITKGWWTLRKERQSMETLETEDRLRRSRA